MEDGLVLERINANKADGAIVLILVVMEDGLVQILPLIQLFVLVVLILVVMEDGLVLPISYDKGI